MAPPGVDKQFPSSKPAVAGKPIPAPPTRQPYSVNRNQQQRRWQRPSCRRICCCCCFWSILILLITILIASLVAIGLYVLYHPRPPSFSVPSLRIHRFNLTTAADSSASHLSSLFNLTLITKNPNSHFTYNYEPFSVSVVTDPDEIFLGNGTVPAFSSGEKNLTSFRAIVVTSTEARELDVGEISGLKSDLKRKNGLDLKIVMDTKVEIRMGKLKSKRVGIRVSCSEIKGTVPKGKAAPAMASTDKSKCKVDLRIKIWNWTF
ncbi:unnamed protein product [Arabis nemorensis]|uniref:Late embryogenesis abundant protein LEA-2 subgroup domain-containing protein n=1 Tax=Arabis nemorensis TaxID=586526 RepID=A0A565C5X1_9BRAS|nr:unnamed protein product [Arabis nemorensis]